MDGRIRKEFFGGVTANEKSAVKAFISHNKESSLKTKPKVSLNFPTNSQIIYESFQKKNIGIRIIRDVSSQPTKQIITPHNCHDGIVRNI
jgi:hypothetical protein